ncbi:EXS family protein [Xylariomycetidae sp. FL0641]|nr:EXS family protein [Xylariomycetidae sp. FL0641]
MDGDPAVEPELDSFSLTFPLPYRVAFIVVLGVWGWGVNLHYLYNLRIDVPALIRYPGRSSPHHPPHHLSTYRLATVLSAIYAFALLVFWVFTHRSPALVLRWDWLPLAYLAVLLGVLALPLGGARGPSGGGRARLRATLRRVAVGGIAEAKDGKFGDILLADVLTSYAKVFGDLYVALCMFVRPGGSATARPDRACGGAVAVPLIMALPSLIRLRQCLVEYGRARRGYNSAAAAHLGWGGQHLANALKYSTAFPVIVFSALHRNATAGAGGDSPSAPSAFYYRLWLAACVVNSLYSFYWDVAKDWDLTLFDRAKRWDAHHAAAPGLRRVLRVGPPAAYYAVVVVDLLLRCTWSLKLSPHLDHVSDFESSIFVLELLEVLRRWLWLFFRIETEWIRANAPTASPGPGLGLGLVSPAADDILLGDYVGKYEDEE